MNDGRFSGCSVQGMAQAIANKGECVTEVMGSHLFSQQWLRYETLKELWTGSSLRRLNGLHLLHDMT
jgi:hypothetical protein